MHQDPAHWTGPEYDEPHDTGWSHDRIALLIGIPLGLILGLAVAFFLIVGSGRDTPTISTTTSSPALESGPAPSSTGDR